MGEAPDDQHKAGKRHQGIADLVAALTHRGDEARPQVALRRERMGAEEQHEADDHHQKAHEILPFLPGFSSSSRIILGGRPAMPSFRAGPKGPDPESRSKANQSRDSGFARFTSAPE